MILKKIGVGLVFLFLPLGFAMQASAAEVIPLTSVDKKKNSSIESVYALATGSGFERIKQETTKDGGTYIKSQQTYKGYPVWGHHVVVVTDKSKKVTILHGYMVKDIQKDIPKIKFGLSKTKAFIAAQKEFENKFSSLKKQWVLEGKDTKRVIYIDEKEKAHLAYRVTFRADSMTQGHPSRPIIYLDANTGDILEFQDALTYDTQEGMGPGGNEKTGKYEYGVDYPKLLVSKSGNTCSFKTKNVSTIDLKHKGSGNPMQDGNLSKTPHSFTCSTNTERAVNGAYSPLNDAQFFGLTVFNMYQTWYKTNPLKASLTLRVHYGNNFENAFWDGKQMTFGDGKDFFYPLVVLDVTAHEVSHGFTEFNSNLEYKKESGGINEAFSDMAGEAAEFFARGSNDFLVGGEIAKKRDALRYMSDPPKDGISIDHVSKYSYAGDFICNICKIARGFPMPGPRNFCLRMCTDVHHSSGIYNKVFHIISTANGWDIKKAFDIFVVANQKYWTPKTTFADGAKGTLDAAKDLGYPTEIVKKAFAEVGINI